LLTREPNALFAVVIVAGRAFVETVTPVPRGDGDALTLHANDQQRFVVIEVGITSLPPTASVCGMMRLISCVGRSFTEHPFLVRTTPNG